MFNQKQKIIKYLIIIILLTIFSLLIRYFCYLSYQKINNSQLTLLSKTIHTLNSSNTNEILLVEPNSKGYYVLPATTQLPSDFKNYLITKEDKYFYYHPGINPISSLRALYYYLQKKKHASSTITQQLVKIILNNENNRSLNNKIIESWYAFCLEMFTTKEEIIEMYANYVYLGNQIQGFNTASQYYFNKSLTALNTNEQLQLLATINSPSTINPFNKKIVTQSQNLASQFNLEITINNDLNVETINQRQENFSNLIHQDAIFDIQELIPANSFYTKIDNQLTKNIRQILLETIDHNLIKQNATHGAVVVINTSQQNNQILSIVGTPDPNSEIFGRQINMALQPRTIGSTIKPLLYLQGFTNDLRPYSLIEDKEYKYIIDSGFAFYPKNYDYQYNGLVNLHYSLANSLNIPTVKVLEYIGINNFNDFLINELNFQPVQDINNYQLGIALGGLEMDLLHLAYYNTIFANKGILKKLVLTDPQPAYQINYSDNTIFTHSDKKIAEDAYIQLVNKILSQRERGVDQFGLVNNLTLPINNYCVKTGTSRDYHDSWTIGYTPDFLVAVWLGNANDEPMDKVSGQGGAGLVWHKVMNLLINSQYYRNTPFNFNLIAEYNINNTIEYGLINDNINNHLNLLLKNNLIITPYNNDIFLFESNMQIPLEASETVSWYINDELIKQGSKIIFSPTKPGKYEIKAKKTNSISELISIQIN